MRNQSHQELPVVRLDSQDERDVVAALSDAFFDYPVMRFVLGARTDYADRLPLLVGLFVAARTLRNDPVFGVRGESGLIAAMTTSNPADAPHPDFAPLREETWNRLGADAKARYDACVTTWMSMTIDRPQLHVNMIGVRRPYRGLGLARRLLREIHALCEASAPAEGVSLTTEDALNVGYYRKLGYEVTGEGRIASVLPVWHLFRRRESALS